MQVINKIGDIVDKAAKFLVMVLTGATLIAILMQVFMRYFVGQPLTWSEELARFCMIWITYIGASVAMRAKTLVAVDMFLKKMPLKVRYVLGIIGDLLMLFITGFLFYYTVLMLGNQSITMQLTPALRLPAIAVYFCLPIGYGVMSFHLIISLIKRFSGKTEEVPKSEEE